VKKNAQIFLVVVGVVI